MATLVSNAAITITSGHSELSDIALPLGAKNININYNDSAWPANSDGKITVGLYVSDNNGASYPPTPVWKDVFEHIKLSKGGVPQTSANAGATLQAPFGSTSKLKVTFDNTAPDISTVVTVTAT